MTLALTFFLYSLLATHFHSHVNTRDHTNQPGAFRSSSIFHPRIMLGRYVAQPPERVRTIWCSTGGLWIENE